MAAKKGKGNKHGVAPAAPDAGDVATNDDAMKDKVASLTLGENPPRCWGDDEEEEPIPGIKFVDYRDESDLSDVMRLVGKDLSEPYSVFTYRYFLHRFPDLCILAVPDNGKEEENPEPVGCVVCKIDEEEVDAVPGVSTSDNDTTANTAVDAKIKDESTVSAAPVGATGTDSEAKGSLVGKDMGGTSDTTKGTAKEPEISSSKKQTKLSGYMAMLAVDTSYRHKGIGTALVRRVVRRMRRKGCSSVTLETEVSNKAAMRLYEERLGFIREELLVRYYLNWGDAYRLRLWFD